MSIILAHLRRFATTLPVLLGLLALTSLPVVCQIQNPQSAVDNLTRSSMHVDPSTGAMQLQIPLGAAPGRGEASLPVVLRYSSKLWNIKHHSTQPCNGEPVSTYYAEYAKSSASGWTSSVGWFLPSQDLSTEIYDSQTQQPAAQGWRVMRQYVTLPDGSRHELRRDDSVFNTYGANQNGVYYAVDGSRLWYDTATDTLFMPNGSRLVNYFHGRTVGSPPTQYIDRNGNLLTFDTISSTWTDTLGRTIGVPFAGTAPAAGDYTYTLPGGLTNTLRWRNLGDVLTDPTQSLRYKGDAASANCTLGWAQPNTLFSTLDAQRKILKQALFNPVVLWQIGLPNNANYTFTYNVYGELNKIVSPTGGSESLNYAILEPLGGQLDDGTLSQANRGVNSRVVSDGVTTQSWGYGGAPYGVTGVDSATAPRSVTAPDGTVTVTWYYKSLGTQIKYGFDDARTGMAREVRVYNSAGVMLRRTLNQLAMDGPQSGGYSTATRNARVTKTVDIILVTGGNALAAATEMTYDADLNVTSTKQYDYVSISQSTGETADIPSIANGALLRTAETDYLTNDASYRARNLLSLPTAVRIKNGAGTIVAQSSINYDESGYPLLSCGATTWTDPGTTVRGNATTSSSWLNTTGAYLQTHAQYDQCGSVRYGWDAKGNQSQVEYSSAYAYAYPTLTRTPVPDPTGQRGSATDLVSTSVYDFNTGQVTSTTDANNVTTSFEYNDSMKRLSRTVRASGTAIQNQASVSYDDVNRIVTTTSDLSTYNDNALVSKVLYDGLGRTVESRGYEGGTNYIATQQQYDSMGRAFKTSNPFRPWQSESAVWTTAGFDALGRMISLTTPDSAVVGTSYSGNTVTVTDQAGKKRKSVTDGLGRLKEVYEDPTTLNYLTSYNYDVLDNLTAVSQGVQARTFVYDSLSRLTSAYNPESGTVTHGYDNNGNLTKKTDARGVYIDYLYDALNRNTTKNYSDVTPDVTYTYDAGGVANSKGRLTSVSSSVSATNYTAYEALGRMTARNQITDGQTYSMSYGYNLAGNQTSMTYPSGRVIETKYDLAGRAAGVRDQQSGVYYAGATDSDATNRIQYASHGAVRVMKLGNGLWEHTDFNNRLQPIQIGLGTSSTDSSTIVLSYNYGTTNNNGNVQSVGYAGGGLSYTQTFGYDQLNRLTTSVESGASWSQTNSYDAYGNRSIVGGGLSFSANYNRITTAGYVYDSAGNFTNDNTQSFGFDAENKIKTVNGESDVYRYDGDGNRVRKNFTYGEKVRMVYSGGQLLAEYDLSNGSLNKEYVYGAKGLIATIEPTAGTKYTTSDHLGTPRVVTNASAGVVSRHDYMPFGEEIGAGIGGRSTGMGFSVVDGLRQKFTSKERDIETGLDYFGARYYSNVQGRFTSPDQPFMDQEEGDPQSWNLYSYVRNNPLKYIDPFGDARWEIGPDGQQHYVGDEDGEYDKDLNAVWVADGQYWDFQENPTPITVPIPGANDMAIESSPGSGKWIVFETPEPPMGGGLRNVAQRGPGLLAKLSRWLGLGKKASQTVPMLRGANGREMIADAIRIVRSSGGTPAEKADLLEKLTIQIMERTGASWNAARHAGTDGSAVFIGRQNELLIISPAGELFRGSVRSGGATFGVGGKPTPIYDALRRIN